MQCILFLYGLYFKITKVSDIQTYVEGYKIRFKALYRSPKYKSIADVESNFKPHMILIFLLFTAQYHSFSEKQNLSQCELKNTKKE